MAPRTAFGAAEFPECVTEPRGLYISRATGKARGAMKYFPRERWDAVAPGQRVALDPLGRQRRQPSRHEQLECRLPPDRTYAGSAGHPDDAHHSRHARGFRQRHRPRLVRHDVPLLRLRAAERGHSGLSRRTLEGLPSGGMPVPVHRFGLDDETDYSPSQARAIMADDFALQSGRAMTDADWSVPNPADGVPRMRIFGVGRPMTFPLAPEWFVTSEGSHLDARSVPISYSVVDGALPAGLSLDAATGVISGTPSVVSRNVRTCRRILRSGRCRSRYGRRM